MPYKKNIGVRLLKLGMIEGTSLLVFEKERIIREYCEQMYANELDNLHEMDKFLER